LKYADAGWTLDPGHLRADGIHEQKVAEVGTLDLTKRRMENCDGRLSCLNIGTLILTL